MTGQITEAIGRWADEIAALGGNEHLTRFRDAKVGTLDLAAADDPTRKKLVEGEPVRVSRLFPHEPLRSSSARSASRLASRLWQLEAGHGIAAGYLATGLASWNDPASTKRPNAPVLLRRLQVEPIGFGEPDLLLHVVGEAELNRRLLDAMADQLGLRLSPADLLDPSGMLRYPVVVDRLREQAPPHVVDGFAVAHRAVIALMSPVADDVARDLSENAAALAQRPFVALAAGSQPRRGQLGAGADVPADSIERARPAPIDLDSSQQRVLDEVAAGRSLAVVAPAGTGATQVAAGLCADAVAGGRTVLVVAESSPRLHGLRRRLAAIGMGSATLDLADGLISPSAIARDVLSTIDGAARRGPTGVGAATTTPGLDAAQARSDRAALTDYVRALHEQRAPRALSAYQAISAAQAGIERESATVRIDDDALRRLDAAALERLRASLRDFIELQGLVISPQVTAWFGAGLHSVQDAETAVSLVDRLRTTLLPAARDKGARAAVEVGMPTPTTMDELGELAQLLADVHSVEQVFTPALWSAPVERLAAATADRKQRRHLDDPPGAFERRSLCAQARSLAHPRLAERADRQAVALATAADVVGRWGQRARDSRLPRTGESAPLAVSAWVALADAVSALTDLHPEALAGLDLAGVAGRLSVLADEAQWARRLPRLTAAATELADAGMGPVVSALRDELESGTTVTPQSAIALLDTCLAASLAEQIQAEDPVLSRATGDELRASGSRWRQADAAAVVAAADSARHMWDGRVGKAGTARPAQVRALRDTVAGRVPTTTREMLEASWSTVVTARPIWLAGPLPAAAALPMDESFDLLVVLDAQSVALAHAAGVLARANQVVVLGDPDQPPPSVTPLSIDAPDPRSGPQAAGSATETPSLFAVLRDQLPSVDLTARHGCRDGRLEVAMPKRREATQLAVTPGSAASSPLRFVVVEQEPGSRDQEESVSNEVAAVVDLVRDHVAARSSASLAVLTIGREHREAVRAALARACLTDNGLADWLGPNADEPFLLRAVDELNGERRDVVILSVGYGRTMDGRLLYRFGALNRPGGTRWLSGAVSTARRELVVTSSLTASDLEPRRLAADGLRALRELLATAEGIALEGMDDPGTHAAVAPQALDPVERRVAQRLHEDGLPVVAGGGTSWLATSMGVEHPGRPGRGVLVVEVEGPRFGQVPSLRDRERLRPEQLMRAGWSVYRLCVLDWLRDADAETERIRAAWREACALADAIDGARNAPSEAAGEGVEALTPADAPPEAPGDAPRGEPSPRPLVAVGRPVESYPMADLVQLAEWVHAGASDIAEAEAVAMLGRETGLAHPTGRTETLLRRAVRAAQIRHRRPLAPAVTPVTSTVVVADPLPTMSSDDEREQRQEQAEQERSREQWLNDERPPHHEG